MHTADREIATNGSATGRKKNDPMEGACCAFAQKFAPNPAAMNELFGTVRLHTTRACGALRLQTTRACGALRLQTTRACGALRLHTARACGALRLQSARACRSVRLHTTRAFNSVLLHSTRALDWRLKEIELTSNEKRLMSSHGIPNEVLQKYHIWRYSSLVLAIAFVFSDLIFAFVGIMQFIENAPLFNDVGKVCFVMEYVAQVILALSVGLSFFLCLSKPRLSVSVLAYGWLISTVAPIWPYLVPLQYLLAEEVRDRFMNTVEGYLFRSALSVVYALYTFPILITVPSGLIRGAMRVRGLLPEGTLAGWLVVASSPLYPLVSLSVVALLSQASGDFILLSGVVLFLVAPIGFTLRRRAFTKPLLTERDMNQVTLTLRVISLIQFTGLVLVLVWAFTSTNVKFGAIEVVQFTLSFMGRLLVTTLVFAGVVLELTASNVKEMRELQEACTQGASESQNMLQTFEDAFFQNESRAAAAVQKELNEVSVAQPSTKVVAAWSDIEAAAAMVSPCEEKDPEPSNAKSTIEHKINVSTSPDVEVVLSVVSPLAKKESKQKAAFGTAVEDLWSDAEPTTKHQGPVLTSCPNAETAPPVVSPCAKEAPKRKLNDVKDEPVALATKDNSAPKALPVGKATTKSKPKETATTVKSEPKAMSVSHEGKPEEIGQPQPMTNPGSKASEPKPVATPSAEAISNNDAPGFSCAKTGGCDQRPDRGLDPL